MKRTQLKRRGRLRPIGAVRRRQQAETKAFAQEVRLRCQVGQQKGSGEKLYRCERCHCIFTTIHAHHMRGRGPGVGHPWLHDPQRNGAGLCYQCHALVGRHDVGDWPAWVKPGEWLDAGGRLQ